MKVFVVFKKQEWEKKNGYDLVSDEVYKSIPKDIIYKVKMDVEDKLYSSEELGKLRDELCK